MTSIPNAHVKPALLRTILLTSLSMAFFASNSLLARLALRSGEIDAGSFTAVRIGAGAAALALLAGARPGGLGGGWRHGAARPAAALFGYALAFSFAYVSLNASVGALVLFAAVQITMIGIGVVRGEHPRTSEWLGLLLAFAGLVYLVSPGLTAPPAVGVLLMALSGMAWGYYSLAARGTTDPISATAGNFVRAVPLAVCALVAVFTIGHPHASRSGIALAAVSGAVTSGLGYAIWYAALRGLGPSMAAIVQLTVPAITAAAGAALLGEPLSLRLLLASCAILGGVALAALGRAKPAR